MSRRDSLIDVVCQIVPGCSVYCRKATPYLDCTSSGSTHHSDATTPTRAVRQVNDHAARHGTIRRPASYTTSSAGPSRTQAVTAALTPPPDAVTTRAIAAGHAQPRP